LRRGFTADVRHQLARESESRAVWRLRFYGAGLSILFGIFAVVLVLPVARGVVSWAVAPGCLLMLTGGVLGVRAQRAEDVAVSRRAGLWAVVCTVGGLMETCIVLALT